MWEYQKREWEDNIRKEGKDVGKRQATTMQRRRIKDICEEETNIDENELGSLIIKLEFEIALKEISGIQPETLKFT